MVRQLSPPIDPPESSARRPGAASPHVWVPSTYFAEGYPYAIVNNLAEVLFQQAGAGLGLIGLTSLLHAPWNLKFLWAPFVDTVATKRRWMIFAQLAGALLLFVLALLPIQSGSLPWFAALFLMLAFASATNDIAIDAYYMEALADGEQAKYVGYRATAYKLATLLVKGPGLALAGVLGFSLGFAAMGALLLVLALVHVALLPEVGRIGSGAVAALRALIRRPGVAAALVVLAAFVAGGVLAPQALRAVVSGPVPLSFWAAFGILLALAFVGLRVRKTRSSASERPGLAALMATPKIGLALAFVVFFRTGESFLQKMKWPFLHEGLGVTVGEYALLNGTLGAVAGFVGTFIGGALIAKGGLRRWFWWFILAQNVPNLAYAALAAAGAGKGSALVGLVVCIEELGSGFGTAVLMVYLMRLCVREHRATHFALLTAIMSLSFTFAGAASGYIAEAVGYQTYFVFTFAATLPMMILGALVPIEGSSAHDMASAVDGAA
jgi:PAT family beta-lactamase induction signal transducer AmpG